MRALLDVTAVPARPVGAGVYTIELARRLATHPDVELHLATRRSDRDRWTAVTPDATVHPVAPDGRPARIGWEQTRAPALARRLAVDVWHGPHYTMPLRASVPTVVTVHDLTFFDHPEWHERSKVPFFRTMISAAARRADAIVSVSEETARQLHALTATRAPIVVAHHGVDHERFRPGRGAGDEDDDRALLGAHGVTPPYIASHPGTMEPRKDIPTLVAAFAGIAAERPDLRLVIAGADGWGTSAVRDAIANSGVATRILRPGYLPAATLPALLRRAEAVAYPSLYEGFGLPALEALACAAPLVTTTGSALEEVVGSAGIVVPPGDAEMLAKALEIILTEPETAAGLRAAGPSQAATFTWSASVGRHLDAYRLAIDCRSAKTSRG